MALQDFVRTEYTPEEKQAQRDQEMRDALMEETGLEGASVDKLRKTMLSAEEAVIAKTEEMNDIKAKKGRKKDWEEFVDVNRRYGKAMHHSDILRILHSLIPGLFVCDGMVKNTLSLFLWDRNEPFEANGSAKGKRGGTVYLGWMQKGWSPEYEVDLVDEIGRAKRQIRGWRTVLLRLVLRRDSETYYPKSLLSEAQIEEAFGKPTNGDTASEFRRQLFEFRNTTPERAKMNHEIEQKARQYSFA